MGTELNEPPREAASIPGRVEVTERLLEAAVEVFADQGFESATVAGIARRCGLTTGAIYARWIDKQELFVAAIDYAFSRRWLLQFNEIDRPMEEIFSSLAANLLSPKRQVVRDLWFEASVVAKRSDNPSRALSQYHEENEENLTKIIEAAKASGVIDPALSTDAVLFYSLSLAAGTHLTLRAHTGDRFPPHSDEWNALHKRIMEALRPPAPA